MSRNQTPERVQELLVANNQLLSRARLAEGRSTFAIGQRVRKTKGSSWQGIIVGTYSTKLTPEGYAVESEREPGSVQIYPVGALELVPDEERVEGARLNHREPGEFGDGATMRTPPVDARWSPEHG